MRSTFAVAALIAALAGNAAAQQNSVRVKEEKAGLFKQAKITPEAATRAAMAVVPNGKIESAELEKEDGKLLYSFDIKIAGKSGIEEVQIDAQTGAVLAHEHETPKQEKAEAKADKKKKH